MQQLLPIEAPRQAAVPIAHITRPMGKPARVRADLLAKFSNDIAANFDLPPIRLTWIGPDKLRMRGGDADSLAVLAAVSAIGRTTVIADIYFEAEHLPVRALRRRVTHDGVNVRVEDGVTQARAKFEQYIDSHPVVPQRMKAWVDPDVIKGHYNAPGGTAAEPMDVDASWGTVIDEPELRELRHRGIRIDWQKKAGGSLGLAKGKPGRTQAGIPDSTTQDYVYAPISDRRAKHTPSDDNHYGSLELRTAAEAERRASVLHVEKSPLNTPPRDRPVLVEAKEAIQHPQWYERARILAGRREREATIRYEADGSSKKLASLDDSDSGKLVIGDLKRHYSWPTGKYAIPPFEPWSVVSPPPPHAEPSDPPPHPEAYANGSRWLVPNDKGDGFIWAGYDATPEPPATATTETQLAPRMPPRLRTGSNLRKAASAIETRWRAQLRAWANYQEARPHPKLPTTWPRAPTTDQEKCQVDMHQRHRRDWLQKMITIVGKLPPKVGVKKAIDLEGLRAAVPQLWAEAIVAEAAGEPVYIDDAELAESQRKAVALREEVDPLMEIWTDFLENQSEDTQFVSSFSMWLTANLEDNSRRTGRHKQILGAAAARSGWVSGRQTDEETGKRERGYIRKAALAEASHGH